MPTFLCVAHTSHGAEVRERVEASASAEAIERLRARGLSVVSVRPANPLWERLRKFYRNRRITFQDIVFAERQLAMMLKSGIDLSTALSSLVKQISHERLSQELHRVHNEVVEGETLSEALAKNPDVFPAVTVGLIRAGEESGRIGECLEDAARLGMRDLDIRSRVRGAFMYPAIVLCMALLVVLAFLLFVLPRFISIFESSGAEIPLPTQILIALSSALQYGWPALLAGLVIGFFLLRKQLKTPRGRLVFDRLKLRLPLFGGLMLGAALTRMTRTLGSLLSSGIAVDRALEVTAVVCGNAALEERLRRVRDSVIRGSSLAEGLKETGMMPEMLLQMVASGEMSGSVDVMLKEAGEFYDIETTYTIRNLVTALEPIMLVVMGVVVGGMALAVLLPLFKMTQMYR